MHYNPFQGWEKRKLSGGTEAGWLNPRHLSPDALFTSDQLLPEYFLCLTFQGTMRRNSYMSSKKGTLYLSDMKYKDKLHSPLDLGTARICFSKLLPSISCHRMFLIREVGCRAASKPYAESLEIPPCNFQNNISASMKLWRCCSHLLMHPEKQAYHSVLFEVLEGKPQLLSGALWLNPHVIS